MITYSGQHLQTIGGEAGTPTNMDIAVHSGRICRFGGAVLYMLLPHLIFVGLMAWRRSGLSKDLLGGLLHDAHEIATCDVPKPFKCDCMRREQSAIDDRIFGKYPLLANGFDHDLIKMCDRDAADIEATQLGLSGYSEKELADSDGYGRVRPTIFNDPDIISLFNKIKDSPFGQPEQTICPDSKGVLYFTHILDFFQQGEIAFPLQIFRKYDLLS